MVASFERLPADAIGIAGGKGASLARMTGAGLPVPRGFVVCAAAFHAFLAPLDGRTLVERLTRSLDVGDPAALDSVGSRLRALVLESPMPDAVHESIRDAYGRLGLDRVAVRSSAVAEDSEAASFAGQQETYLNVVGGDAVIRSVRDCWASFFSPRAIFYRAQKGTLDDTRMAVVVQEMVLAEKSGVLFTVDPVRRNRERMVIEAVFGLGEAIVSGLVTPDHYVVDRASGAVVDEFVAMQETAIVYDAGQGGTRQVELSEEQGGARVLTGDELQNLRTTGLRIESFFGAPQDVEWCIRGGELLILQSRPITTLSRSG